MHMYRRMHYHTAIYAMYASNNSNQCVPRPKFFAYVTRRKDGSAKTSVRLFVSFVTLSEKNRSGDERLG